MVLAKSVIIPLGLTAAASVANGKSLVVPNLFMKGVTETIESETKKLMGGLLRMSVVTSGASLLANIFSDEEVVRADRGISPYP